MKKLRYFALYVRDYGFIAASVFALFKLFPRWFLLLARQSGNAMPAMAAVDYRHTIQGVYDDSSWQQQGGAAQPVSSRDRRQTHVWFVPDWTNVWGGGHYTLFRFAQHFAGLSDSRQIIYIYNNQRHKTPDELQATLRLAFPDCKLEVIVDPKRLPAADAAFATTWQSAYSVKAFPFARKKFYFMQDYESTFYAFGTASMQANHSYELGFTGITGGTYLKSMYEKHGGVAQNYRFAADRDIFYPAENPARTRDRVTKLFFYGRPSTERRCFELGIAALQKIAEAYPDVEIVIAGLDLEAPPPFKATLLGNMTLRQTGELYRTCDIGMAFSGTNLSYLPVELMACGVPVICNNGPQVEWHCQHMQNAYLVAPTPEAVLQAFRRLYDDRALRQQLIDGGLETMRTLSWEDQMTQIHGWVQSNMPAREAV